MLEPLSGLIRQIPFLRPIPGSMYPELIRFFRLEQREYEKGETIFRSGDRADSFGVVISGKVQSVRYDMFGSRNLLSEFHAPESFAIGTSAPGAWHLLSYVAAKKTTVLLFYCGNFFTDDPGGELEKLVQKCMMREIVVSIRRLERKNAVLAGRTIRDRLLLFLSAVAEEYGASEITIGLSREELADYLSVNRSALSREIGNMVREGILSVNGNTFCLYTALYDYGYY